MAKVLDIFHFLGAVCNLMAIAFTVSSAEVTMNPDRTATVTNNERALEMARFMLSSDLEVQYFLVFDDYAYGLCSLAINDSFVESTIHAVALRREMPMEFGGAAQFDRRRYAFRHQSTRILFFTFPKYHPGYCHQPDLVFPLRSFPYYGGTLHQDSFRDVFIQMMDMSMPWEGFGVSERINHDMVYFPANVLLVNFNSTDTAVARNFVEIRMISFRCDSPDGIVVCAIPLQRLDLDTAETLKFSTLLQLVKNTNDMNPNAVDFRGFSHLGFADKSPGKSAMRSLRGRWSLRFAYSKNNLAVTKMLVDWSNKSNFSIWNPSHKTDSRVQRNLVRVKDGDNHGMTILFVCPRNPYRILYSRGQDSFVGILDPIKRFGWVLLLVAVLSVTVSTTLASNKDRISVTLPWTKRLLSNNKVEVRRPLWLIMAACVNAMYIAELFRSELAPPQQMQSKTSFVDLVDRQIQFFTDWETQQDIRYPFLRSHGHRIMSELPTEQVDHHHYLIESMRTELLASMGVNEAREFLELREAAWVGPARIVYLFRYMAENTVYNKYGILNEKFLDVPTFVDIRIVQDDRPRWYYLRMCENGMVAFWEGVSWEKRGRQWVNSVTEKTMMSVDPSRRRTLLVADLFHAFLQQLCPLYAMAVGLAVIPVVWTQLVVLVRKCRSRCGKTSLGTFCLMLWCPSAEKEDEYVVGSSTDVTGEGCPRESPTRGLPMDMDQARCNVSEYLFIGTARFNGHL